MSIELKGIGKDNRAYKEEEITSEAVNQPESVTDGEITINSSNNDEDDLLYGLNEVPPWYLCLAFGLQHYLLAIGSLVGLPLLLADHMCIGDNGEGNLARANLISSMFVVSGTCTVLQTTFGNRLPIMQGSSYSYLPPTLAILALSHNQCPNLDDPIVDYNNMTGLFYNDTDGEIVSAEELWQRRMREVQGAIAVASCLEVLLGFSGAVGFLMRFIGPLTIMPTVTLIGLDLFTTAALNAEGQWGVAIFTSVVLILSSQYLKNIKVPFPSFSKRYKCHINWVQFFKMFPVIITLGLAWLLCYILTVTNAVPNDPSNPNYGARTDIRSDVIENSQWFRFPYPGQWGLPRVTLAGVIGMFAAVVASMIESIGDYNACARLAKAPPPPSHAINRGIMTEGIGCTLAGVVGTTSGTSSFSQNVAAIGITRVASRRVLQVAGFLFIALGLFSKIGSIFATIPDPIIGGIFFVMFGTIAAVGLSNLQYVDLNSSRNIFIIGFTLFMGLSVANWMKSNPGAIQTGVPELDQIFTVLLSSAMLVGGMLGAFLDNSLPGTEKERGLKEWKSSITKGLNDSGIRVSVKEAYDLPFPTNCCKFSKYLPISPEYQGAQELENERKEILES